MTHDLWAGLSSVELAGDCLGSPTNWFLSEPKWKYQTYALKDPATTWPIADGSIEIAPLPNGKSRFVAVEFKRRNEGIHGVLTGIGQVHAYLKKGFSGAILVLPRKYDSLEAPGTYATGVLEGTAPNAPIGVFTYDDPDFARVSPFEGRIACARAINLDTSEAPLTPAEFSIAAKGRTQWAHVREGSTVPDYFYRYLKCVLDTMTNPEPFLPTINAHLKGAATSSAPSVPVHLYLSSTSASGQNPFADEAWRRYWYRYVLTPSVQKIWHGKHKADKSPTALKQWDGSPSVFFARRGPAKRSKQQLVEAVATGTMTRAAAWLKFAESVRERAHSHREDLDSGLEAIGLLGPDGRLTDSGFRFVKECDRSGDANAPGPVTLLRWSILVNGGFSSLLHYIHSLSEREFQENPLRFSSVGGPKGSHHLKFDSLAYRKWLAKKLVDELRVANSSALRGGRSRPPLEAELILLRKLGLVVRWRSSVGVEINWPAVHSALELGVR